MSVTFRPATRVRGVTVGMPGAPELNVNNRNAALLLERLDLQAETWGEVAADDLLGRALVANVGRDDSGVEATEMTPSWTEGGARPGYFEDRMAALVEIANWAKAQGGFVDWG
jgi:hypothetical protein